VTIWCNDNALISVKLHCINLVSSGIDVSTLITDSLRLHRLWKNLVTAHC